MHFYALSSLIKSTRNGRRNTRISVGLCFIVLTENLGTRIVSPKFILRHLRLRNKRTDGAFAHDFWEKLRGTTSLY